MPVRSRHARLALATALLATALTGAPAQANFVVSGEDPAGDSADPARDLVRVGLAYNRRTGTLHGGVQLDGSPTAANAANLTLFAGVRTATGCNGFPAIGFGTQTDLRGADWVRFDASGAGPAASGNATKTYTELAEDYEATDDALAGRRPDCVVAQLNEPGNSAVVYDVAGPFPLRALPELEATVDVPVLKVGAKPTTVRLKLRNVGDAPTGRVRLRLERQRHVTARLPRSVGSLRPGQRRTVRVRLSGRRPADRQVVVRLAATAAVAGVRATAEDTTLVYRGSSGGSGGGGGGGGGGDDGGTKLCSKYTWLPPYTKLVPC